MAENKRYYWLQLQKDFFKTRAMKKLRSIAGGDTYTIIYLKMQLLSLENGGLLYHEGVEENMLDEIALDIDESIDNVKIAFQFLEKCNLIESKVDQMYLPEAVENIGSETASAQRVRRFRASRGEKALQCNSDVTNGNTDVQNGHVELELELEKELKIEKEKKTEKKSSRFAPDLSFIDDTELYYVFDMWCRGKGKKYKNQIQVESGYKKLFKLSSGSVKDATDIVEYSLAGNYEGLFALKEKQAYGTQGKKDNFKRGGINFEL